MWQVPAELALAHAVTVHAEHGAGTGMHDEPAPALGMPPPLLPPPLEPPTWGAPASGLAVGGLDDGIGTQLLPLQVSPARQQVEPQCTGASPEQPTH